MSSAWGNVFATSPQRNVYAVNGIADLKILSVPTGNATVNVDYGAAVGDGLGDLYSWNPGDARADNGSSIIQPNSAPAVGRWNAAALSILALALGAGTVGAPSLTFAGDITSGFYRPTANQIGISISGVQRGLFNSTGLSITGSLNATTSVVAPAVSNGAGTLTLTGGGIPWQINVNGHLVDISGDNLHDVGISGDRFRTGNFGTSVVTPLVTATNVNSGSAVDLGLGTNNTFRWGISSSAPFQVYPSTDNTQDIGTAVARIAHIFTPIIDSGTTGSLSLKTNNGIEQVRIVHAATAVNQLWLQGSAAGNNSSIAVEGSDSNIGITYQAKNTGIHNFFTGWQTGVSNGVSQFQILHTAGSTRNITVTGAASPNNPILGATGGGVAIVGTTTNDSANTGQIGELVTSTISGGSAVALTTGVAVNITSITLGSGDWDVTGSMAFQFAGTTSYTNLVGAMSTLTGALDAFIGGFFDYETAATVPTSGNDQFWTLPTRRIAAAASTTIFLVAQATFTVSTLKAYGTIRARRMR